MAGDGQVTLGDVVLKHGARKIRTLYDGQVLAGFAGAVADALTLFAKFEQQLKSLEQLGVDEEGQIDPEKAGRAMGEFIRGMQQAAEGMEEESDAKK